MDTNYEKIFEFLNSFHPFPPEVFQKLYDSTKLKEVKAGERLVKINDTAKNIYLLINGVLRSYFVTENGKEITKIIFTPIEFFASFTSLLSNKPSKFIYEALTDCHIYAIDYQAIVELSNTNIEVLKVYTKYLENLFLKGESKFIEISTMDAMQRYKKLRERIPEIDNLIAQYQIASYLNVTPVQLSRIRAKIYNEN